MRDGARLALAGLAVIVGQTWSTSVLAYRPFDGTDAAVAGPGEFEVELGPAQYVREGAERTLIAPAVTLNYGVADRWEFVVEGQTAHGHSAASKRTSLVGNAALLKGVLREGGLQDKPGPSVATEFGLLLPGINDEPGVGGTMAGIVSQQWPWFAVHLNLSGAVTREQHGDLFASIIVEGPRDWAVRPVAEVLHEHDFGRVRTTTGLVGAIWQVRESLAVDVGFRAGRVNDHTTNEIRAGLTFSLPMP
jgi:hypothetical protein